MENKYSNGKIYKININNEVYVGSTIMTLKRRLWHHKYSKLTCLNIKDIDVDIELIEDYPCSNGQELRQREQYWIERMECINKRKAYQSKQNRNEYKKQNDKKNYELRKQLISERSKYRKSWGGDKRFHNNLLEIDIDIFTD